MGLDTTGASALGESQPEEGRTLVRVMALHALAYCERLFYLEEVEHIRVADHAVWAGRREHLQLEDPDPVVALNLESEQLGLQGRLDAVRRRDGTLCPVEHKRGRSRRQDGRPAAWDSDRLQVAAYALLLEEHSGRPVTEARIRYHRDNATVCVEIDGRARSDVLDAVARARSLAASSLRPPVTEHASRCERCSLVPVCLPEEQRFARRIRVPARSGPPRRLFPADVERRPLHVVSHGARIGRAGQLFAIDDTEGDSHRTGAREVSEVVLHGNAQISTQALRLCAAEGISVHWLTVGGEHLGCFAGGGGGVKRRIRQFTALCDSEVASGLARRIVMAKIELQLRYLLRTTRPRSEARCQAAEPIEHLRAALRGAARAPDRQVLVGHEGSAARAYFRALPLLLSDAVDQNLRPVGRSRRPPRDRFNALLSYGYTLLYRDTLAAILCVGLDPAFGVLHQPHSTAFPLALDLMEIFRVPIVDVAVLGAVNRRVFDPSDDFVITGPRVWLSESGKRKLIAAYERRKQEEHRHPVLRYKLSYARMLELEVRLLEKEWSGEAELFARLRLR